MPRIGRSMLAMAVCAAAAATASAGASAASLGPIGTYTSPMFVTSDPADEDRLFIVERAGRIRLTHGDQTTMFLDLTPEVPPIVQTRGEGGLLSMAFAPDFSVTGRFYVFYTGTDGGALHVDELTASVDTADPATRRRVVTIPHPTFTNHNGGQLQFGPDGYLYVSTGDGGGSGDPAENAQNTDSLLGKILRLAPTPGGGYTVPADNPFVGSAGADEVWSYGLRNPWRFSFDRLTGDLVIGDVGQGAWEEIDFDPVGLGRGRGDNFGWDCYEGRHDFEITTDCPALGATTQPVFEYPNPAAGPAAVAGGYVVRDPGLEELYGRYVYADTYVADVRSLSLAAPGASGDRSEGLAVSSVVSFGEDACGRVYVVSIAGPVSRIVDGTPTDCAESGGMPNPADDLTGPRLVLEGDGRQSIKGRRTVSVEARAEESGHVTVDGVVIVGKRDKVVQTVGPETVSVSANVGELVAFKLPRSQARRYRQRIERGRRVNVEFEGTATDESGNRGPAASFVVRLVLR